MKNLTLKSLAGVAILLVGSAAPAQINLSTLSYSQNFDALGSASAAWTDNSTLPGWYAANDSAGVVTAYTAFTVGAGGGTSSSTLYALGVSGASERALGAAPASTRYSIFGLRLLNDTGSAFDGLQIQYDLEQWSDRGTARITLSYQKFAAGSGSLTVSSGWTTLISTDSPLPENATPVSGIGNTTGLLPGISAGVGGLGLPAGDELWVRWEVTKIGGSNSTHGIDNVVVTVPEPSVGALAILGGLLAIRRGRSNPLA